jgi:integrase/recombinase XerD
VNWFSPSIAHHVRRRSEVRHWFGSTLVGDGADLRTAQTLLRHANLNTTAIYVQVSDPKRVEAIDRLRLPE